jgi:hypothetical protein
VVTRVTSLRATVKNACGQMVHGITGSAPAGDVDLDAFCGREFSIYVKETEQGGSRVENLWAANVSEPPADGNAAPKTEAAI